MPKAPPRRKQPAHRGASAPYPPTTDADHGPTNDEGQHQAGGQQQSTRIMSPPPEAQLIEPMSVIEKRYRTFISKYAFHAPTLPTNNGPGLDEPHDPLCYECFHPGQLVPCGTCRKVCHADCMPPEAPWTVDAGDPDTCYCPVCVSLGWNNKKQRPTPNTADKPTYASNPWFPQILTAHPKAPPGTTYETSLMLDFALKKLTPVARAAALPVTGGNEGVGVPVASAASASASTSTSGAPVAAGAAHASPLAVSSAGPGTVNGGTRGSLMPISRNNNTGTPVPAPPPAPPPASVPAASASLPSWRKSRFDILSGEVGTALSVVYRELEEIPLLRRTAEELESKLSGMRQDVNIYKNEIALLKRMGGGTQMTTVTARKNDLERENVELRSQLEKSDQALREWKGKLAGILGQKV
ncbi:uncharacterized protein DSM5745_03576 [Aspergillus mulundensis]|uniref:PHD-type domain-containing protein n=1 Tax=Aspergillus mulundensis TaxID=1810919 RepID=A0A3D8SL60_9EURO|nr:hypothetical protein DSM5745_03576 [Aspergillus mulundensis]RDW86934.1 hypothetical protein DSM5745_03576 [Aspergillus mulundensis]